MKFIFPLFILFSFIDAALAADSKSTPMTQVTIVCSDAFGFIAIDESRGIIWLGEDQYQVGDIGVQVDDVTFVSQTDEINFTGIIQVTWGQSIYKSNLSGKIGKLPLPATLTLDTSQRSPRTMMCQKP